MKNTLLKIAAVAAGVTLALCVVAACAFWYTTRLKPWNDKALVCMEPPSFGPLTGDYKFYLSYNVKNNAVDDYTVTAPSELRIEAKLSDGSLSYPLDDAHVVVRTPIFIPARQLGTVNVRFKLLEPPTQRQGETDDQFHERLREFLNDKLSNIQQFVLFDQNHRYQIVLPRWAATKPPAQKP